MATNDVYINPGTVATFKETAGTVAFTPSGIAADTGRISARYDVGGGVATARPDEFAWSATTKFNTAPTLGETVDVYWASSDSAAGSGDTDGNFVETDAAILNADEDHLKNLLFIGSIIADEAAVATPFQTAGVFRATRRYGQVVWWNKSAADALSNVAADHVFTITPIPMQVQ